MADNEHEGFDRVEPSRRKFLLSFLATAFAAPVVASFALDGVAHAGPHQMMPNQAPPTHMLPNQARPDTAPPNHMLPNQARPDAAPPNPRPGAN